VRIDIFNVFLRQSPLNEKCYHKENAGAWRGSLEEHLLSSYCLSSAQMRKDNIEVIFSH
jgi:hypothetical protein